MENKKVAVVGAGIYGASIAVTLARKKVAVDLYDGRGLLNATSATNQYRVHHGYHYPRSLETIREIQSSRESFLSTFAGAVVGGGWSYYAIPHEESRTSTDEFEDVMKTCRLDLKEIKLDWLNYGYIKKSYLVQEALYSPNKLRAQLAHHIHQYSINFIESDFNPVNEPMYDYVVYATYGLDSHSKKTFKNRKIQVAEKILFDNAQIAPNISLVVIDGPFTAFDWHPDEQKYQFGSAKHTNIWTTTEDEFSIPEIYSRLLYMKEFKKIDFTQFELMKHDAQKSVPILKNIKYKGSKLALRVVDDDPETDKRLFRIQQEGKIINVFSGKVVSAMSVASKIADIVAN